MSKKTKTRYDAAFKAQCIEETGKTYNGNISQAAQGLGLPMQTLHNWVKQAQAGKLPGTEHYNPELATLQKEIKALRKSLKTAEMERDILKKPRRTSRRRAAEVRLYENPSTQLAAAYPCPHA